MTKPLHKIATLLGILLSFFSHVSMAQRPTKQWDRTFGGSGSEFLYVLQPTQDGGYILGGCSTSPRSGDKTQGGHGGQDYWLVKVDASGTKQWDKTYGGSGNDQLYAVVPTTDGGYLLGGISDSEISGDKTQPALRPGTIDYWLLKLDASGTKQWDKTLGSSGADVLAAVQQTPDGGYAVAGHSFAGASGDKTQPGQGDLDFWLLKLDANGTKQWDQTYGGRNLEFLHAMQLTSDGGFIMGGLSNSGISGDKTQPALGIGDYWVVKVNANGVKQWDRTFGGRDSDYITTLQATPDEGYLLGGYSGSGISADKTQPCQGEGDYWVVKLDARGTKQWDKTYGGADYDYLYAMQPTRDGGYILGGYSHSPSSGDKAQPSLGGFDCWLVKLDASGTKQWDQTYGGSGLDNLYALLQTVDGGYLLGGTTSSGISGDQTQPLKGESDYWLVKLGESGVALATQSVTPVPALTAYPNPTTSVVTLRGPVGTPYHLLNQLGQVVRWGALSPQPLDMQALPAGLYLLRNQTNGQVSKVLKE